MSGRVGRATIGRIGGQPVRVWNTAAAGVPSADRVRASIDEALAALAALPDQQQMEES